MLKRIWNILRHRWYDIGDVEQFLTPQLAQSLAAQITASELQHTGEIRICVEAGMPLSYLWRGASSQERAHDLFGQLRVWDTPDNNGVLIYLLMADRAIEILSDRGIQQRVEQAQWQSVVEDLGRFLHQGRMEEGLSTALQAVDAQLTAHFPLAAGAVRHNHLPNAVVAV